MAAISTTETRIGGGSKVETVTTSCGKFKYKHYASGGVNKTTRHGVGIITPAETNLDFRAVNERLCKATIHQGKNKPNIVIITAYAPTLKVSTTSPQVREQFFNDLDSLMNTINKRDILL